MKPNVPLLGTFAEPALPGASVPMRYDPRTRMNVLLRPETLEVVRCFGTLITDSYEGRDQSEVDFGTQDFPLSAVTFGTLMTKTTDHNDQGEMNAHLAGLGTTKTGSGESSDPDDFE